jgi:methylmalonyl-CoA mutase C-terminal domain/subunit
VETAIQEDVDAIGLSVLSGAHMTLFPRVVEILHSRGIDDIVVFGGGIIPDEDIPRLEEAGLAAIFTPGAPLSEITEWVEHNIPER